MCMDVSVHASRRVVGTDRELGSHLLSCNLQLSVLHNVERHYIHPVCVDMCTDMCAHMCGKMWQTVGRVLPDAQACLSDVKTSV